MRKSIRKSFGKRGLLPLLAGVPALLVGLSAPVNANPWQVGDVFAGISGGQYNVFDNTGVFVETISDGLGDFTTGCAFNNDRSLLYTTNFGNAKVPVYDVTHPHNIAPVINTGAAGGGGSVAPESIVFRADGSFTVGHADGDHALQEYDNTNTFVQKHFPAIEARGTDWHDTASDQTTVYYTSEGNLVKVWDLNTMTQGADFSNQLTGGPAYALRLLPPGDGTGGMLVADTTNIKRLDSAGTVSQTYDQAGENQWFSLNLDPNGMSFWAGSFDTNQFYRFNIASGTVEVGPIASGGSLFGLCVLGEPTAATVIEVMIDVKAFSDPNGFNCKKKGVLPVTIWGMDDFDVSEIDLTTVQLKLTDDTDVGGPVVNSLICDRGDPDIDKGSAGGTLVADCFDAAGLPGQDGVADMEGGTPDGFDDIDVRFDAQTVIAAICPSGTEKGDIIPTGGLVIMGELNSGVMFTSVPVPDVGIDQLLVQQVPKP